MQKQTAKPYDWVTSTEINPAFGEATGKVDQNGKRTDVTYDGIGRKTAVWLPNRAQASQTANATFAYQVSQANGVPTVVTTNVLNAVGKYNTSYALYDGLLSAAALRRHIRGAIRRHLNVAVQASIAIELSVDANCRAESQAAI